MSDQRKRERRKLAAMVPLRFQPRHRFTNADGDEALFSGMGGDEAEMSGTVSPFPESQPRAPHVLGGQGREYEEGIGDRGKGIEEPPVALWLTALCVIVLLAVGVVAVLLIVSGRGR